MMMKVMYHMVHCYDLLGSMLSIAAMFFRSLLGLKFRCIKMTYSRPALKTFGLGLLDILQSMDQTPHETMLKVAEATFDTLHLSQ
jgi:hypothetical protein